MPDSFYGMPQIIPLTTLGNLADAPPTNPTPWDDEFEENILNSKWTSWNQQTGQTITIANSHLTMITPSIVQNRIFAILQPAPIGNWKFRAKMAFDCASWDAFGFGLVARRITGNDRSKFGGSLQYSGHGSYCYYTQNLAGVTFNSDNIPGYRIESAITYWELEYEGTNLIWRASHSGFYYTRAYSYPIASWTGIPEFVGISIYPWGDSNVNWGGTMSCDWFRRVV